MNYSQHNEEKSISDYFKNYTGKFMDIGAFHPFVFSNTRRLYELGWSGVFVEPSPICFAKFVHEYSGEEGISLVNAVVTEEGVPVKFYESNGDALSTTDINHKKKWEKSGVSFKEVDVRAVSVKQLVTEHKGIDFLSLDVEGKNMDIFNALPDWFLKRLKLLCIEHDSKQNLIAERLDKFGFVCLMRNAENIIFGK